MKQLELWIYLFIISLWCSLLLFVFFAQLSSGRTLLRFKLFFCILCHFSQSPFVFLFKIFELPYNTFQQQQRMDQLLDKLEKQPDWKKIMRQSCRKNGLKTALVNELSLLKLRAIGSRLTRSYENIGEKVSILWLQNQLKTFHWVLVALSALHHLNIQNFRQEDWLCVESIFSHKDRCFLKFQAKKLLHRASKKTKYWKEEQNKLLQELIPQVPRSQFKDQQGYQWNQLARKMFECSGQTIFRTGKHCRQRWLNYLDPSKQRGQWSVQQDLELLEKVYQNGKKWSEFALEFNRTEHSVKNRFNSVLMRQQKLTPEIEKQEKLLKIIKKSLEKTLAKQSLPQAASAAQNQQDSESIQKKEQFPEKVQTNEAASQKQQQQGQNQGQSAKCYSEGILQDVRQEQQIKNLVNMTDCHPAIYSPPFWSYSPNNFINSSSPLSYYLNQSFANCFARLASQLQNFTTKPEENV